MSYQSDVHVSRGASNVQITAYDTAATPAATTLYLNGSGMSISSAGVATLTTPALGAATATSVAATGAITSSGTAGIGYATGAGGAVTQITNRTTGVTLSKLCGTITTDTTSLAAEASANFTVTNTLVAISDVVVVSIRSGSDGGNTAVSVVTVAAGSFVIKVSNNNAAAGTAETGAIIINFLVLKGVSA